MILDRNHDNGKKGKLCFDTCASVYDTAPNYKLVVKGSKMRVIHSKDATFKPARMVPKV